MRVLTLTPFYPSASDDAAGCFIAEPIRAMQEFDIESYVIAVEPFYRSRTTPNGHPAEWVRYAAIPGNVGLASSGRFVYASLVSKVRNLHRERRFDLIHAHAVLPCGHSAVLLSRELAVPFVVTVHGFDVFLRNQVSGFPGRWCQRVAQSVYGSAARVVSISRAVANELSKGLQDLRTTVIHNGVDSEQFLPRQTDSEAQIILSVGNLIPTKGHASLLQAFASLQQQYPNISCEIIGDGPERSALAQLAEDLKIANRVTFYGRQSRKQVAEAMKRCTIFALPSRYEGLGCVYFEAMSAGKPAIACRGQGIEDVIQHRQNGWLVDPGDSTALANSLSELLNDRELRERIGAAARATILDGFTLRHQAAKLAQLYRECAA